MELRSITVGIFVGILIAGCAGITFPYKYYGLKSDSYNGSLLGPTAQDDVNLEVCAPTLANASPCTVMLTDAYLQLKEDYLTTKQQLVSCQQELETK